MKMIEHNHFICHSYCHFSVLSHIILSDRTWRSGRSLVPSSDSVGKIISCNFSCFVPYFFYHQYGICRMYSKENPQYFRLPVPCLYSWERVMLLLSDEAAFKPCGPFFWQFTSEYLSQWLILCRPSLTHKGSGYPIFRAELPVGIIGVYGICGHTSYPYIHEFLLHTDTVLKPYTLIEGLEGDVFDEWYTVASLCSEFNRFCFLASYNGAYIMTVNAATDATVTNLLPFFSCTRTFLMIERRFW